MNLFQNYLLVLTLFSGVPGLIGSSYHHRIALSGNDGCFYSYNDSIVPSGAFDSLCTREGNINLVDIPEITSSNTLNGLHVKVAINLFTGFFEVGESVEGSVEGGVETSEDILTNEEATENVMTGALDLSEDTILVTQTSGVDANIAQALGQALNFTYDVLQRKDGVWGNPQPDGSVTGVIGMVARQEVAFALCAIAVSEARERVVDFAYPYHREPLALFSRAPKVKSRLWVVFSPFTPQVWLCIAASVLSVGVAVSALESVIGDHQWSICWSSFNMFRNLVVQGNLLRSERWSQRFLFFFWYIFCLIVYALYSGNLTAMFTIPSYETPVNSLDDLPKAVEDGYTIGILKDTTNELLFKESKSGIYKQTWDLMTLSDTDKTFVARQEDGIDRALNTKYIFIGFKISNEIVVAKLGKRKFHVGRQPFFSHGIGVACPPGAPYRDAFSKVLLRLVEGGFISKWFKDEINKVSRTDKADEDHTENDSFSIGLQHLQTAFFLLILGFGGAIFMFIIEKVFIKA